MVRSALRYKGTNFITGLRAIAALGVVMIHTGGAGLRDFGMVGNRIADLGSAGVYVFFVISGFAVTHSFLKQDKKYSPYLVKRLRRIVPLYFFWLGICIAISGSVSAYNAAMHLSLLSFLDATIANSIIGVEWSIPIEVFYYLMMPVAIMFVRGKWAVAGLILGGLALHLAAQTGARLSGDPNNFLRLHWSPIPYAFSFALGMAAFRIKQWCTASPIISYAAWLFAAVLVAGYCIDPARFHYLQLDVVVLMSVLTFIILICTSDSNNALARRVLCSEPLQWVGLVSYGVYLSHVPIFGYAVKPLELHATPAFFLTAALSIAVSSMTLFAIERPGQTLGTKRSPLVAPAE